jgi:hypothetical protein
MEACLLSLTISPDWTLIKGEYEFYAEYYGSTCPEGLENEGNGIFFL